MISSGPRPHVPEGVPVASSNGTHGDELKRVHCVRLYRRTLRGRDARGQCAAATTQSFSDAERRRG